ncbi:MAG: hypothetical protein QM747_14980 [Nocardioides sp.]
MSEEQELAQLRARVVQLEALVGRLTGASRPAAPPADVDDGVSRRRMLRNGLGLSAAAVAGIGALDALGSSAAAADGDNVIVGQTVSPSSATSAPTTISNPSSTVHGAAMFRADNVTDATATVPGNTKAALLGTFAGHESPPVNGVGVLGLSDFGVGVQGGSVDGVGVVGVSQFATAVSGTSTDGVGVQAVSTSGSGLTATSTSGKSIVATSTSGEAIHASSDSNIGIVGLGPFGVVGTGTGNGDDGTVGTGVGASGATGVLTVGTTAGVDATSAAGIAIKATSTSGRGVVSTSSSGTAVDATSTSGVGVRGAGQTGVSGSSANGVGGVFQGDAAAVRLVPRPAKGHPTSGHHQRGELVVDNAGTLWLCTKPGSPGKWKALAFA